MRVGKETLSFIGKILLALLKSVATRDAFTAFLVWLDEKAAKTSTKLDDYAVDVGWIIRDKIWYMTEEKKRAELSKRIINGTLTIDE